MEQKYYIYRGSKGLSGYYVNDIQGVFAFRRNDFITFKNQKDAENFIIRVRKEVNSKQNQLRYGLKYAKINSSIARNLYVSSVSPFY
jgi:hypothetical protein